MLHNTIDSEHAIWTRAETEQLIVWLEEPENLRKIRKGSGITKRQVIGEIAATIPTKAQVKVGYKYNNLLKSYREAVKLNSQSGWGLTREDIEEGKKALRDKLLSRCPYFFRREAIFGDRPNIRPPAVFDSGISPQETAQAAERLIAVMGGEGSIEGVRGEEERNIKEGNRGQEIGESSQRGKERGRERDIPEGVERHGVGRDSGEEEDIGFEEVVASDRSLVNPSLLQQSALSNKIYSKSGRNQPRERGGEEEREVRIIDEEEGEMRIEEGRENIREGTEREEGRRYREVGEQARIPEGRNNQELSSSAIRQGLKRRLPQPLDEEDEEDPGGSVRKGSKKKKGGTLIDAVTILASAKTEGESQKFDFLNRHLVQQSELRREELVLERERLAIEREKSQTEQKRTELMMLQLQASMRSNQPNQNPA